MSRTISFENEYYKISIEDKGNDEHIDDFVELCKQLALAVGYHHSSVADAFGDNDIADPCEEDGQEENYDKKK